MKPAGTKLLASAAAMGAVLAVLYLPVLSKLVYNWWADPDYSHAFVVVPLALFLIWQRRAELSRVRSAPSSSGLVLAIGALLLLIAGTLGAEIFVTRMSMLVFAAGTIVYLLGWRHLRVLAFPLLLIALTIPIPAIIISRLTLSLQLCASTIAEASLSAASIPVLREGNVLVLPNAKLQVAEACSGIRSLTALVTLALLVARFSERRWLPRLLIIASAVPIAVLVNGLRVAASSIAAYWYGTAAVEGFVHELLGWVMFIVAFALMAAWAKAIGGRGARPELAPQ